MSLIERQLYRFVDFELQPSTRTLTRGGKKVALAPKTFDVLVCLVERAGRVVSKDELLTVVWPGAFVEEGNLTQHVFSLRKALGDKAECIVTLPGRGYQFTAKVAVVIEAEETSEMVTAAGPGVRIQRTSERAQIVVEEMAASSLPATRRWIRPAVIVGAVLAVAVMGWGVWRWMHRVVPGDHHEVVVADFENFTGDPDLDKSLKTLLAIDLNDSPYLAVASDSDMKKLLKLMNRPPDSEVTPTIAREVCERLNDQVVLTGLVTRAGQKYLVTLTATDCANGKDLVRTKATASERGGMIKAVDTVAADMRERLGEPLKNLQHNGQNLVLAHTFSLEALQAYSQARALHVKLKFAAAVPLYKRAIELDPNFTDAHAQLANCYNNLREGLLGEQEMAKAYELRDLADEPVRLKITSMYEYWKTGDRYTAIRNYQKWADAYPLQSNPWVLLGEFQASVGNMQAAEQAFRHAVSLNPGSPSGSADLAEAQRNLEELEDAKATATRAISLGGDNDSLRHTLLEIAFVQHDSAGIQQQLDWFKAQSPDDVEGIEGDMDASQGKMRSAVAHYLHIYDEKAKAGMNEAAQESFATVPELEVEVGLTKDAQEHFKRYVTPTPLVGSALTAVIVAATELGQIDLAQKKLDFMRKWAKQDTDVFDEFAPEGQSAIDLAEGKMEAAVSDLQRATPYELSDPVVPMMRARTYLAAKQAEPAQRESRWLVDHPSEAGIGAMLPMAHLGLARASKMAGNLAVARQEYEAFFALWKDGDADLPIVKQARNEYESMKIKI